MLRFQLDGPFRDVIGTFMGRDAISLLISALRIRSNDAVLLPAFLCREVSKPFLGNASIEFYDLQSDLAVDPEVIRTALAKRHFRLVYIINYFGFLQPHRHIIRAICAEHGAVLAEDCAHSLLTEFSGETGDASIYSFRKILPLPDGGGLKLNIGTQGIPQFHPKFYSNVLSVLSLAKRTLNFRSEVLSRSGMSSRAMALQPVKISKSRHGKILPISSYTQMALKTFRYSEIIEKRRTDYEYWRSLSAQTESFAPLFPNMPIATGVCPLGFPVIARDRPYLKAYLDRIGIHLRIHWPLPSEVGSQFVRSHQISSQICTLPVYPDLSERERDVYSKLFGST